jgi:ABC-2 type transport system ATP-binding protein
MNIIEINNLTKNYITSKGLFKSKEIVRGIEDVSFSVKEGEKFGFIGPNGAGKSTTIRTLLGLIKPSDGYAKILGRNIVGDTREILEEIGYLPSEVFYYNDMKIIDLLKYSASFYKRDCSSNIKKYADSLELDLNRKFDELSFGNRKKVGIVQALIHEPKLLILDEPTSGLDPLMQKVFFEIIEDENKKGTTIFFSSHILNEVQKICDRVAIIKKGKIIKIEDIEILKSSNYKKIKVETKQSIDHKLFIDNNIVDLNAEGSVISFLYNGNINSIVNKLSDMELSNLLIEEPTLEEVFMHYYERED